MQVAQHEIAHYCVNHADIVPADFRFMMAWLYQQLPSHGWRSWSLWRSIQKRLGLALDLNYRLNLLVLAVLPQNLGRKYFETLIKLKR
jgi:hypothetical protein